MLLDASFDEAWRFFGVVRVMLDPVPTYVSLFGFAYSTEQRISEAKPNLFSVA